MPPGRFDALQEEDSSDDEHVKASSSVDVIVPSHEDLSMARADEETVLTAVYGEDFTRQDGVWGCARLSVHVRPPDTDREHVGSELTLSVQLGKQYPYVVPKMDLCNVIGLNKKEQRELMQQLEKRAQECAKVGAVMMCELVQVVEDYLLCHNRDPNMSEWEQMKAREAQQRQEVEQARHEEEKELERIMMETHDKTDEDSGRRIEASGGEVEKELARQMEALVEADRKRRGFVASSSNDESRDEDGESEDDFDDADNDYPTITAGTSRYQSDFIEMGVLGRGGGGEVVKVRNRLDRRLYAVKKIELESEEGKLASVAAIQNRKLRREVTTISRMMHRHIVRYYQAWIEGGEEADTSADGEEQEVDDDYEKVQILPSNDDDESSEDEQNSGWWTNSPTDVCEHLLSSRGDGTNDFSEHSSASWVPEDDDTVDMSNPRVIPPRHDSHSASIQDLLGQEQDFQSPLLAGMGFQNQSYHGLFQKNKRASTSDSPSDEDFWDDSGVKIDSASNKRILYIQMEYCSTTLRKLIDESTGKPLDEKTVWRMVRQMLEALVYIHSQKIIHRDLKPGNVFLDSEGNIRLGDFGLATRHRVNVAGESEIEEEETEAGLIYDAIEDISGLLGGSRHTETRDSTLSAGESMTGGVGTTFYRAPEQEHALTKHKGESAYGVQADIFSLGVILFEMFHPPFETYMERAETLSKLRGESISPDDSIKGKINWASDDPGRWKQHALRRFPASFEKSAPENAQRMILWCLERMPARRPSAEELLASELLPKGELEQRYLEEALVTLTNPQSESYQQILGTLFARPTPDLIEVTFDTDAAAKANNIGTVGQTMMHGNKRVLTPSEGLMRAISDIRVTGGMNVESLASLAMSASSLVSATSALRRAKNAGKMGKGGKGVMKRSTQRTAGILAMNAASSAAITGAADGVHGADPHVVEAICAGLSTIFKEHGAVRLRPPLMRPRPMNMTENTIGGPAEVLNPRGTVLLLPEDLTVSFARALGRGGAATSNIKRYDIDRVYHKSLAGGHPRESLEASYDIIREDSQNDGNQIEVEALMVVCQAIEYAASMQTSEKHAVGILSEPVTTPLWFIRLTHTRLVDSIMDVCGVPQKESAKKIGLQIFAHYSAPAPGVLFQSIQRPPHRRSSSISRGHAPSETDRPALKTQLDSAVKSQVLPKVAARRLEVFLESGCSPLPADIDEALDNILSAIGKVKLLDAKNQASDPRRLRRYEDIARIVKSLKNLVLLMRTIGIGPLLGSKKGVASRIGSRPLYLALDLGLRQKRKHYNDTNRKSIVGLGTKVAEGGRYDDLVRKYRPPGNFATAMINHYTTAQIPMCMGVRFHIGKFVELAYIDAALAKVAADSAEQWNPNESDAQSMEVLRLSLGHPLSLANTVQCIVTGVHGMDSTTAADRLLVASRLWAEGVSAEYMAQSGVMLSLLKRYRESIEPTRDRATDWSLEELFGVCAILKIPFVVIVQPHLLRDKGSVRLRRIAFDSLSFSSGNETIVPLESLASTIALGVDEDSEQLESSRLTQNEGEVSTRQGVSSSGPEVECIYVDTDQYYGIKQVSKTETSQWKAILKRIKGVTQRSEAYLSALTESQAGAALEATPVFAVNISFWELRNFGTCLMRRGEYSAMGACQEVTEIYPKHKKLLKTLGMAIDNVLKKSGDGKGEVTILLYSTLDDRFDMVTLECHGGHGNSEITTSESSRRKGGDRR